MSQGPANRWFVICLCVLNACSSSHVVDDASQGDAGRDAAVTAREVGPADIGPGDVSSVDAGSVDVGSVDTGPMDGGPCLALDADHDGHASVACGGLDCDDDDAERFPGNLEVCDPFGHDEDCDPVTYGALDGDGDGYVASTCCNTEASGASHCGTDCDDSDARFHPGAAASCGVCPGPSISDELCNAVDDDCDGTVDDGVSCVVLHGVSHCVSGACAIDACDPGFVVWAGGCEVAPPRPLSPPSTSTVTSRRPTLRWVLAPPADAAHVDLCADRACTRVLASLDASGDSTTPTTDLPVGVVFWRLRSESGSTTSPATSATWQFTVGALTAPVDSAWGTTLDVDGDGFADVAIGAPGVDSHGAVFVYLGGPSGLTSSPATMLAVTDVGADFGSAVESAGDVDGDGFCDVIVGGYGRAYVYRGSASGLAGSPATSFTPSDGMATRFGESVASAGDVDGDGYADVIVGTPTTNAAVLYRGSATGLTTAGIVLSAPDGYFGGSVASAGDVNGDGYGDVVVGAHVANEAYLYLGSPGGLATIPAAVLVGPDGGAFGRTVANAGDVNGDGMADLLVLASASSGSPRHVYVYVGSASGPALAPTFRLTLLDAGGNLAASGAGDVNGDGLADLVVGAPQTINFFGHVYVYLGGDLRLGSDVTGIDYGAAFGNAVAGAGDVDGDGHGDVVVGANRAELASRYSGHAHLLLGTVGGVASLPAVTLGGPFQLTPSWFGSSVY